MSTNATSAADKSTNPRPTDRISSFDLDRAERILKQLEARSVALVKYGHHPSPRVRPSGSDKSAIGSALAALWLSTLALAYFFISDHVQWKAGDQVSVTGKRVISGSQIAKTLASSSRRPSRLEATAKRSKAHQRIESPALPIPESPISANAETPDAATASIKAPREPFGNAPRKVIFVGKGAAGVVVRDLADGKYYTVTSSGSWSRIRVPPSKN
jgi:hypothetical protein